jgi:hypothetical protein
MRRKLKHGAYLLAAAVVTPIAIISAEKAISHLLFWHLAKFAPKSSQSDDHPENG